MSEKRYAQVGDLVIHKHSGEIGRVREVHAPNEYLIASRPVSCPVVVLDSGTPFIDMPGKTLFDFIPDKIEASLEYLRGVYDAGISESIAELVDMHKIDAKLATAIVGSIIRERMKRSK